MFVLTVSATLTVLVFFPIANTIYPESSLLNKSDSFVRLQIICAVVVFGIINICVPTSPEPLDDVNFHISKEAVNAASDPSSIFSQSLGKVRLSSSSLSCMAKLE